MSNQLKKTVDVYYKEGVIAQIGSGQYGVINCKGDELEDNLIVKVPEDMTPVMFKDITGTVTVNGYVELLAEDGTAAKRVYLNIQVPSEYMLQGTYDSGYEYKIGDIVVHRGEVFVKIGEGQTEPVNGDIWQLFGGAIQDEKEVDIITYGKLEFEPDEGYVAVRKLIANVANVTMDATATEELVAYGYTFYAGGEKKAGAMKAVDSSTFSSLALQNVAEGKLEVQYYADKNAYLLNNKGQTRPGTIGTIVEPLFKEENIAEGVTLFGLKGKHGSTPIFDGTINIESGYTTISGSYVIDASKAYDALAALPASKTYLVEFSAGSIMNGEQEKKGFISMTFNTDGDKSIIYGRADGSITAFSSGEHMSGGNGFEPYYNAYEEGNGAIVNFYEGTECRKEFKELFLSIADEYVEPENDSIVGTWVFNHNLYDVGSTSLKWKGLVQVPFSSGTYSNLEGMKIGNGTLSYCISVSQSKYVNNGASVYSSNNGGTWNTSVYKTINILSDDVTTDTSEWSVDDFKAWLKANATKQG